MTETRALIAAAQAARDDPRLQVEHRGCEFRTITHRLNWVGEGRYRRQTLTPEPLSAWMTGPDLEAWLREAAGRAER